MLLSLARGKVDLFGSGHFWDLAFELVSGGGVGMVTE